MVNKNLLIIIAFSLFSMSYSQNNIWERTSERETSKHEKINRLETPSEFQIFNLNLDRLKTNLTEAPSIEAHTSTNSPLKILFPNTHGDLIPYEVFNAPVMEAGLAVKFPNITSYSGKSLDKEGSLIRFSITSFGLHAIIYNPETGTTYIDTYTRDLNSYIIYNREDITSQRENKCFTTQNTDYSDETNKNNDLERTTFNVQNTHRTYRLAMACTPQYADFHIQEAIQAGIPTTSEQEKKEVVLSAMVATMNRVNFIFERDNAIHLNLVENNDDIIFLQNPGFDNTNAGVLINQSQQIINRTIGPDNYDIGHTVSTGAGGLARLGSPCNDQLKAMGVTGSQSPVGDLYDVDFVSHEMGHQFGATHTFNSSCNENRSNETSVEPGSGNTIMGYAGVCPPDEGEGNINVKQNSDPFFHSVSILQIANFTRLLGDCSLNTPINSTEIIANGKGNKIIPKGTPFFLEGETLQNSTQVTYTYSWEQIDKEITQQSPLSTATKGPNFRYEAPSTSSRRYLPNFPDVIIGNTTKWEVLSTVPRAFNFRYTVRDNNLSGGTIAYDDVRVIVNNTGPFTITYPNSTNENWEAGTTKTIKWNVAGTDGNGINTSHVRIKYSADNGISFTTLIENTRNDGSEEITVPEYNTLSGRILIEPTNNTYYSLSKKFRITGGSLSTDDTNIQDFKLYPNPTLDVFNIEFNNIGNNETIIEVYDLRGRLIQKNNFSSTSPNFREELSISNFAAGVYFVSIQNGKDKVVKKIIKK